MGWFLSMASFPIPIAGRLRYPRLILGQPGRRLLLWAIMRSAWADLVQPALIAFVIE
jgi:hypothetical protein